MIEAIAPLFALFAEYLKTREDRDARIDADAFKQWLEQEAFPRLLAESSQTLQTLIGLKAAEKERFDTILEHLLALRAALAGPTVVDRWRKLQPADQAVLRALFEMFREHPNRSVEGAVLSTAVNQPSKTVRTTVSFLEEKEWVDYHGFTGAWAVDLTPAGTRFVWEVTDAAGYRNTRELLARHLLDNLDGERIGKLAQAADVPYQLALALVQEWVDQGLLRFEDNCSPPEAGLVHGVTETFRRSMRLG